MAQPLADTFDKVKAQDVADYGFAPVQDYLTYEPEEQFDWIITNPPFRLAEAFIEKALCEARVGCAFLVRTTFIESVGRYNRLFSQIPPSKVAQFVERVPMVKGRLDRKASTATGYCWLIWEKGKNVRPELLWIPPCRRQLEFPNDYPQEQMALL